MTRTGKNPGRRLVYGPVASRRFGISLGVDPLPPKTCCFDCIYCQQGRTTRLTTTRDQFVKPDDILEQIQGALTRGPSPDVVTLAGSGEPTLYTPLGHLIQQIRKLADMPVVVLTNGALFTDPEARQEASHADVLGPSLDAGDEETFARINRPHPAIRFADFVQGLRAMREQSRGRFDLEVFLARGVNDSPEQIRTIAEIATSMEPDSIQLNTAVRPTPSGEDLALDPDRMESLLPLFGPSATIIASFSSFQPGTAEADPDRILATLERRPCTTQELATALGMDPSRARQVLLRLHLSGRVVQSGTDHWSVPG